MCINFLYWLSVYIEYKNWPKLAPMSDCLPVCLLGLFWTPRSLIRSAVRHAPLPRASATRALLLTIWISVFSKLLILGKTIDTVNKSEEHLWCFISPDSAGLDSVWNNFNSTVKPKLTQALDFIHCFELYDSESSWCGEPLSWATCKAVNAAWHHPHCSRLATEAQRAIRGCPVGFPVDAAATLPLISWGFSSVVVQISGLFRKHLY